MGAERTADVLRLLKERWQRPLDITTIGQAQEALHLDADDALRWNLFQKLQAESAHLADKRRYGVSAVTVTLTNDEKLAGRALLLGASEDTARRAAGIATEDWQEAKQALVPVGLLATDAWRLAAGHERLLDGVGMLFHTVRTRGETFNVP